MITTKPFTILFVEDEKAIRENYVKYLELFYKHVYEADNGEDGYKIYKEKKPDILIVDIHLPKMSGLEMLQKIRQNDHATKAIMLTAHSNLNYLLQATELKLTKYLVKPVSKDELEEALSQAENEISHFNVIPKKIVILKDNYKWDIELKELYHDGIEVKLTPKERELLDLFFLNTKHIFSYDELIYILWSDSDEDIESIKTAIKTTIKNVRKKLPLNTIVNVYGSGYRIEQI